MSTTNPLIALALISAEDTVMLYQRLQRNLQRTVELIQSVKGVSITNSRRDALTMGLANMDREFDLGRRYRADLGKIRNNIQDASIEDLAKLDHAIAQVFAEFAKTKPMIEAMDAEFDSRHDLIDIRNHLFNPQ